VSPPGGTAALRTIRTVRFVSVATRIGPKGATLCGTVPTAVVVPHRFASKQNIFEIGITAILPSAYNLRNGPLAPCTGIAHA